MQHVAIGFLFLISISSAKAQHKVVCYWQGIISANEINPQICSHIIFAFIGVHETGELFSLTSDVPQKLSSLVRLKQQNKDLSVMAAVGGANEDLSRAFSIMSRASSTRGKFVANIVNFLTQHSLTGVDIDWEYPSARDKNNFSLLLRELKEALEAQSFILSIAVAPDVWRARDFYDIPKISETVDFINLMTYDFHGSWDTNVGHHAQMFPHFQDSSYAKELNCAASVTFWLLSGAPANKLVLGIPTYGKTFVLSNAKQHSIGSPVNANATRETLGILGYDEYCASKVTGWKQHYDTNYRSYYAVKGNSWLGFDSVRSVVAKTKFAKEKGLGGVMFWSLDTEDRNNLCDQGAFPLVSASFREQTKLSN